MKKAISAGLAALLLSTCSCSRGGNAPRATTTAPAVTTAVQSLTEGSRISSGKSDLSILPEGFPSFPDGCSVISTEQIEFSPFKYSYTDSFTRIKVKCIAPQLLSFSNTLRSLGWDGGAAFDNGKVTGHWCNDRHFITVSESEQQSEASDGTAHYLLTLDIVRCQNRLPEALVFSFPEFTGGYTRNKGEYYAIDLYGNEVTAFSGAFNEPNWMWSFRFEDAFFGVTRQEYEDYLKVLEHEGFGGIIQTETTEFGDVYYVSAERAIEGYTNPAGVYLCYISYLSTLELIFSNDITVFDPSRAEDVQ